MHLFHQRCDYRVERMVLPQQIGMNFFPRKLFDGETAGGLPHTLAQRLVIQERFDGLGKLGDIPRPHQVASFARLHQFHHSVGL